MQKGRAHAVTQATAKNSVVCGDRSNKYINTKDTTRISHTVLAAAVVFLGPQPLVSNLKRRAKARSEITGARQVAANRTHCVDACVCCSELQLQAMGATFSHSDQARHLRKSASDCSMDTTVAVTDLCAPVGKRY